MAINVNAKNKLAPASPNVNVNVKSVTWHGKAWKVVSSPFIWLIEKIIALFRSIVKAMNAFKADFLSSFHYTDSVPKTPQSPSPKSPAGPMKGSPNTVRRVSARAVEFDIKAKEIKDQIADFNFEDLKILPVAPEQKASMNEHVKFAGEAMAPLLKLATVHANLRQTNDLGADLLFKNHHDSKTNFLQRLKTATKDLKSALTVKIRANLDEILATFELIKSELEAHVFPEDKLTDWVSILFFLKDYFKDNHGTDDPKHPKDLTKSIDESLKKVIDILNASAIQEARAKVETQIDNITGIGNLGNSCYMNSVLQALFSSLYLSTLIEGRPLLAPERKPYCMTLGLADVKKVLKRFRDHYQNEAEEESGSELRTDAREFRDRIFSSGATTLRGLTRQHDAQELMIALLEAIGCTLKYTIETSAVEGEVTTRSINSQDKNMLHLEFPKQKNSIELQAILDKAKLEKIDDPENKWTPCGGEGFQRYQNAYSITEKIPEVLVVHMKRFKYDDYGGAKKIKTPVTFDSKECDFSTFIDPQLLQKGASAKYRLRSYVNHHGSDSGGGHYTANIRKGEQWFNCDDEDISTLTQDEEKKDREQAYLLVFERIHLNEQS